MECIVRRKRTAGALETDAQNPFSNSIRRRHLRLQVVDLEEILSTQLVPYDIVVDVRRVYEDCLNLKRDGQ